MGRIFITGSSDGLGKMAAKLLINNGHHVVLHARNEQRAEDALKANPKAKSVLIADLSSISETIALAAKANALGHFDAIIHNAGVGYRESNKILTVDKLPHVFAINSLSPYLLTSLIEKPKRLIYMSSGLHRDGDSSLDDLLWEHKTWNGFQAYADSKSHNVLLAFAVANQWTQVASNALEQVWLASSLNVQVLQSGGYYYHKQPRQVHPESKNHEIQQLFIDRCSEISGIKFPS
ncbi:SDR family NAD(P)-dependent oxidoreductase [Xanthocytophaga agilis]|uniref:SDR family NAD(P)-dependent oxidoreductase n=1 Tax=Xanthocytophaga agilis TaxID=3048010 RepID=A0AAE3R8S0_9BACT|nr:SDR family NAD(P)-dependent oxidoreductase [Xanthocytophaga agilis]MDJ1505746.1 SDR family NAD(P)-dependent oxidoreductase [Xanthocytophaga agilis]